jgi:hypothetical protein
MKNRTTRKARDALEKLGGEVPEFSGSLEIDWQRQIIWSGQHRIAAGVLNHLRGLPQHRLIGVNYTDEYGDKAKFHYNLTLLSAAVSKAEGDVEAFLQSD